MAKVRSRKRKTILAFLICLIAAGGVFYASKFLDFNFLKPVVDNAIDENKSEPLPSQKYNISYSFYLDDDLDKLSNAEEIIWGSDPKISDTDSDGYQDGDEIKNGYDPLISGVGKGRLQERPGLTLSQKYFLWLREQKNIQNPVLEQNLAQEFLSQNKNFDLPNVSMSEIKIIETSDTEALKKYLQDSLDIAAFPESYLKLSQKASEGDKKSISKTLEFINENKDKLSALMVPKPVLEIHKKYLAIFKSLGQMVDDLNKIEENPIQVALNIQKGQYLVKIAVELEKGKLSLVEQYSR